APAVSEEKAGVWSHPALRWSNTREAAAQSRRAALQQKTGRVPPSARSGRAGLDWSAARTAPVPASRPQRAAPGYQSPRRPASLVCDETRVSATLRVARPASAVYQRARAYVFPLPLESDS